MVIILLPVGALPAWKVAATMIQPINSRWFGFFKVSISTNGTLIGQEEAALLKATCAKVLVSIDGPEAYHDKVRGLAGTFKRASQGIEHLANAGVLVGVVSVICEDNLALLPWLAE